MDKSQFIPVFDGHNDVLLRIMREKNGDGIKRFFEDWPDGHLDWPRIVKSRFMGGFFALYVPQQKDDGGQYDDWMKRSEYTLPLPDALDLDYAREITLRQAALLLNLEHTYPERFKICTKIADIHEAHAKSKIAAIFHMEGADAIDADFAMLDVLYGAGLRSLGPVWSRPTRFGTGVPFQYPSSPDTGEGLTDLGKELVRRCNQRNIMIDLSHLNEKGFWDVAQLSDAPLVATHSAVHALCASSRNLTDKQLAAIKESKGMVGVNFAVAFLREDGQENADTPLSVVIQHIDYLIKKLGVDHVGLGSDFDGATIPKDIGDVAGTQNLINAMRQHGYDEGTLRKIAHENWIALLGRVWKE